MKTNQLFKSTLALTAGLVLSATVSQAALYRVTIDTSSLSSGVNAPNAPFLLDFQLNDGNLLNNNTATIGNFTFTGGGAPFGAANLFGGASGSLANTVTLTDSSAFNEFYQSFATGTQIAFDLNLTSNVAAGLTPDSFSFSILEGDLDNITTTGIGNTLLQFDIDSTNPNAGDFVVSSGTGDYSGVNVTVIPEPSSALCGLVALGLGMLRRRRVS